jgi:hypothetical protein
MPLEQVLALVAGQTSSRPSVLYPLYSNSRSFTALKKSLRGEVDPATSGWTNLAANPFGGGMMGPGMPGMGGPGGVMGMAGLGSAPASDGLISLNIVNQDISLATLAFSRFAQARVVPEDGVTATVNVMIQKVPVNKAVAQLARAVKRDWKKMYALQAGFNMASLRGPGGPGEPGAGGLARFVTRGGPEGDSNRPPQFAFGGPPMSEEQMEEARKKREKLEEDLKQTLPIEERQRIEQVQAERQKLMEDMANLTPEQRRDRFQQMMGGQNIDRMMKDRLMNSTPEQRAEMDKRMRQMRGAFGGPGGGAPGGGPPR